MNSVITRSGPDVPTLQDKVNLLKDLGYWGIDYTLDHRQLPHLLELLKQDEPLEKILEQSLPFLKSVSINGLDGRKIVPLDQGNYDVLPRGTPLAPSKTRRTKQWPPNPAQA